MSADLHEATRKAKKRERREKEPTNALDYTIPANQKSKKSKTKASAETQDVGPSETKIGKKKSQLDTTSSTEPTVSKEHTKKRKSKPTNEEIEGMEDAGTTGSEKVEKKKRNKRKREEEASNAEGQGEDDASVLHEEPVKKKSKNKTGFPDPQEDSALSDQAQKALSYAFIQFRRPKKWKFHKARQNWLIRNFWSEKSIPEAHVPLVLKYLTNVQGGVRENLLRSCNDILKTSATPPDSNATSQLEVETGQQSEVEGQDSAGDIKRKRASELLDVLQSN